MQREACTADAGCSDPSGVITDLPGIAVGWVSWSPNTLRAKYLGEHWRKGAAQVHLRRVQQEGKLCTPLSVRGRGLQSFRVAPRWGCDARRCF